MIINDGKANRSRRTAPDRRASAMAERAIDLISRTSAALRTQPLPLRASLDD
jgi:hypothetical protein